MAFHSEFVKLLKEPFGRIGHNWDEPERVDPACNRKFGFKGKPKPTVDLSFERKNESTEEIKKEGDESKYSYTDADKTKTVLKIDHECRNINSTWTFASDKWVGEATGTLLDDDWKVKAGVGYETKPAKAEWKGAGFVDLASPVMSGVKAALYVSFNLNETHRTELTANFFLFRSKLNMTKSKRSQQSLRLT